MSKFLILSILTVILPLSTFAQKKGKVNSQELRKSASELESVKPKSERKVLIFSQTNGYRHKSIPLGLESFSVVGKETGAFKAVVSNDLSNFEPENIKQFDAICFLNTTGEVFSPDKKVVKKLSDTEKQEWEKREKELKESFMGFIKSGKGFIGVHAATDTFYKWPDYVEMIGGTFDGHPWGSKTEVSIKPESDSNKIIAYLNGENLEFKEEIYQYKGDEISGNPNILLRLDPHKNSFEKAKRNTKNIPVAWTKTHGEGRIFYSSLGHNNQMFTDPQILQHYLNGIQWALGDLEL